MPTWSLIVWLVIGGVAGLVARGFLGGHPPFGKVGDIVIGIAGAIVGGMVVATLVPGTTGGLLMTIVSALIGALALIWLSNKLKTRG